MHPCLAVRKTCRWHCSHFHNPRRNNSCLGSCFVCVQTEVHDQNAMDWSTAKAHVTCPYCTTVHLHLCHKDNAMIKWGPVTDKRRPAEINSKPHDMLVSRASTASSFFLYLEVIYTEPDHVVCSLKALLLSWWCWLCAEQRLNNAVHHL